MAAVFPRNLKMKERAQWAIVQGECCRGDQPNVLTSGYGKELNRTAEYGLLFFYGQAALHVNLMLIGPERPEVSHERYVRLKAAKSHLVLYSRTHMKLEASRRKEIQSTNR